jgi:Cys-rich four helix bundle protein (predicted Tat secretion target)
MNRRDVFAVGLGLGIAAVAHEAAAAPEGQSDKRTALLDALHACIAKGEQCQAHCQTQLANGNKEFAHCMAAVLDMLDVCRTTAAMVARQSPLGRHQVVACQAACNECSTACAEHKAHFAHNMHLECKACLESCDVCAAACAAFLVG